VATEAAMDDMEVAARAAMAMARVATAVVALAAKAQSRAATTVERSAATAVHTEDTDPAKAFPRGVAVAWAVATAPAVTQLVAVPCVTVAQRPDAAAEVGHTIRHFRLGSLLTSLYFYSPCKLSSSVTIPFSEFI
jgi:hypothetical protein